MRKNKKYTLNQKRIFLIWLNNALINECLDYECVGKFDNIFNIISMENFDLHLTLFNLWYMEKNIINSNDRNKVKKILKHINEQLKLDSDVNEVQKVFQKVMGGKNEF